MVRVSSEVFSSAEPLCGTAVKPFGKLRAYRIAIALPLNVYNSAYMARYKKRSAGQSLTVFCHY